MGSLGLPEGSPHYNPPRQATLAWCCDPIGVTVYRCKWMCIYIYTFIYTKKNTNNYYINIYIYIIYNSIIYISYISVCLCVYLVLIVIEISTIK